MATLVAAVAMVPVAWASHLFTDVPDSNPFHDDITAVKEAGITSGKTCTPPGTPPTYCPQEPITREAMAAFVHRGFGRVADVIGDATLLPLPPNPNDFPLFVTLATATIYVGGAPGGKQMVLVTGIVTSSITSPVGCPCTGLYYVDEVGDPDADSTFAAVATHADVDAALGVGYHTTRSTAVFEVPTGVTTTFRLVGANATKAGAITARGEITAMTAPFQG